VRHGCRFSKFCGNFTYSYRATKQKNLSPTSRMPNGEANSPRFLQRALNVSGQITGLTSWYSYRHEQAHIPFRVPVF
jgi:hypothetical protein